MPHEPKRHGMTAAQHWQAAAKADEEAELYSYGNGGDQEVAARAREKAAWHRNEAMYLKEHSRVS